jgi:hypothetical protein
MLPQDLLFRFSEEVGVIGIFALFFLPALDVCR